MPGINVRPGEILGINVKLGKLPDMDVRLGKLLGIDARVKLGPCELKKGSKKALGCEIRLKTQCQIRGRCPEVMFGLSWSRRT